MLTITPNGDHYEVGQHITMSIPDRRKWRRFLAWVLRRPTPVRVVSMRVAGISGPGCLMLSGERR